MKYIPFIIIIAILCCWTYQRNHVFRSEVSLWEDNFLKSPNKTRVCVNLAFAYKKVGEDEKGVTVLTRAITIQPDLVVYFKMLTYAAKEEGYLVVEKDVWSPIR